MQHVQEQYGIEIPYAESEKDEFSRPICSVWHPQWIVTTPNGSDVGITLDDGCFVVLCSWPKGEWHPTTHIPPVAAEKIGSLRNEVFD